MRKICVIFYNDVCMCSCKYISYTILVVNNNADYLFLMFLLKKALCYQSKFLMNRLIKFTYNWNSSLKLTEIY